MGVGQPDGRQPEDELGGDGHPQVPRRDALPPGLPGAGHRGDECLHPVDVTGHPTRPPAQALVLPVPAPLAPCLLAYEAPEDR